MDGYELKHTYKVPGNSNAFEQQRLLIHQGSKWLKVKDLADSIFGKVLLYAEAKFNDELKRYEQVLVPMGLMSQINSDGKDNSNSKGISNTHSNGTDVVAGISTGTSVSTDEDKSDKHSHQDDLEPNLFVVKKSEKRYADNGLSTSQISVLENVVEETRILKNISAEKCDNIVELIRSFSDQYNYFSVFPYYNQGELFDYIVKKKNKYLDEAEGAMIFRDIVRAVVHIHKNNVAHLDISPENVMLHRMPNGKLKAILIDFGLARSFLSTSDKIKLSASVGKARYMSPEMYAVSRTRTVDAKPCDIWTLGTTLFVMLFGVPMYEEPIDSCATYKLMGTHRKFKEVLHAWEFKPSDLALDIIQKILVVNPNDRPKANEILDHKFFDLIADSDEKVAKTVVTEKIISMEIDDAATTAQT